MKMGLARHFFALVFAITPWLYACSDSTDTGGNAGTAGTAGNAGSAGTAGGGGSEGGAEQQFIGTPTIQQVPWAPGQKLKIDVKGGNIRFGEVASKAIVVNEGAAPAGCGAGLCVQFTPIVLMSSQEKEAANQQMKAASEGGNLVLEASQQGQEAVVSVSLSSTPSAPAASLSAVVNVWLPAEFDGDIAATAESGAIVLRGVRRGATARTGLGTIDVKLEQIAAGASSGELRAETGDVLLSVPASASISVQGQTGFSGTVSLDGQPGGWQTVDGSTEQAATFCGNNACNAQSEGNWFLKTEFGDVRVTLEP
jgi:hypothetical protein